MNSFLSWVGGKSQLAPKIIPLIPKHSCYVEVFSGAAWLYFKKPESDVEILNDINTDLVTLYRVVKNHLEEFIRCMKWTLTARGEYDKFKAMPPESLTDIQRAVRFYYLLKCSFGSKVESISFNVTTTKKPRINLMRVEQDLSDVHIRIADTFIENRPYQYIIQHYDKPGTFMYLDPPYFNFENQYGKGIFSRQDFTELRDMLAAAKGCFLMSINDTPEIRELYKQFTIRQLPVTYTLAGANKPKKVNELLIMNYDPDKIELAYPASR